MPYRVDEGVRVSPTGLECSQSESWKFEADRCFGTTADDCEGSARLMQGILRTAAELDERGVDMQAYPTLRALANFQKHYLPGLTVLAANAGHADAANQESATLAGHCILSCVSKYEFARARAASLGASAGTGEKTVPAFEPAHAKRVRDATFSALYPPELLEQLNEKERPHFESYDTAHALHGEMTKSNADPVFLLEGTAFASSRAYTHTFEERATRSQFANEAKRLSSKFEPNIARGNKTLDCGAGNKHAFYDSIVEFGVSTRSPLFTDAALRSLNAACTNFRFAQLPENGVLKAAGASPKELASREYALSPMFSLGTHDAATLTEATEEALANAMPMRGVPMRLSDEQADNVSIGLESLRELHKHLNSTKDTPDVPRLATTYILSWASIVENPASIESLCASLMEDVQLTGDVCGIDDPVKGLAVDETGDEMGRLVHLELSIPC
jgi:hypothetical protein